jgi:hypothetical protein
VAMTKSAFSSSPTAPTARHFRPELRRIDHRAAGGTGDGQADLVDELDIAAIRDLGDRAAQHVQDVQADDRNVITHEIRALPQVNPGLTRHRRVMFSTSF